MLEKRVLSQKELLKAAILLLNLHKMLLYIYAYQYPKYKTEHI